MAPDVRSPDDRNPVGLCPVRLGHVRRHAVRGCVGLVGGAHGKHTVEQVTRRSRGVAGLRIGLGEEFAQVGVRAILDALGVHRWSSEPVGSCRSIPVWSIAVWSVPVWSVPVSLGGRIRSPGPGGSATVSPSGDPSASRGCVPGPSTPGPATPGRERRPQPGSGAVHTGACGAGRAAEHRGDLRGLQLLPGPESQQLRVGLGKVVQRGGDRGVGGSGVHHRVGWGRGPRRAAGGPWPGECPAGSGVPRSGSRGR